jgi:hypothetical protein
MAGWRLAGGPRRVAGGWLDAPKGELEADSGVSWPVSC